MTHQPEQPNPARPVIDFAKNFYRGGLSQALQGAGMQMPEWSSRIGRFLNNPAANMALGVMTPMSGVAQTTQSIANPSRTERFMWPVRTNYGKTIDMPITVNPSRGHIQRELAQAPHGDVRALRAPNGDVYMWPANEAMHVDIADNFDLPFKTRADLQKSSYLFNKKDVDALGKFSGFDDLVSRLGNSGE